MTPVFHNREEGPGVDGNRLQDDEEASAEGGSPQPSSRRGSAPQPPANYDPSSIVGGAAGNSSQSPGNGEPEVFQEARRFVTMAQIMSLVSLVVGGVVLSTAAIVVAIIGYRKIAACAHSSADRLIWQLLRRSAIISLVMALMALVISAVSLAFVYPLMMDFIQSGDMSSLLGGDSAASGSSAASGNSTWG